MKHADSLAYDWWKDPPDTLGKPNNYLLSKEELDAYTHVLAKLKAAIDTEGANVVRLARAYETKRVRPYEDPPKPVTVASALEFMLYVGKEKLALTEMLVSCTRARVAQREAEQAELRG